MHSFWFGGTDSDPTGTSAIYFGAQSYGLTLVGNELDFLLSTQSDVQDVPYGYGGASWGGHHPGKLFALQCVLKGDNWDDVKTKIDAINLKLDINRLGALRFDVWNDRYWMVRLTGRSRPVVCAGGAQFDLEFTAPDPRAYALTETTQTVVLAAGTNTFTVPASGTLAGTAEPDVVWLAKPTGSGSTNPMAITNVTRDEAITYAAALTTSEWLRITATARQEKAEKTVDSGANYTASNASLQSGSRFPKLSPGLANSCTLTGCAGTGSLVITYRARYN